MRLDKQRLYRQRIADGVCTTCGVNKPRHNVKTCQGCFDKVSGNRDTAKATESKLKLRLNRIDNNLCVDCGEYEPVDIKKRCNNCLKRRKEYNKSSHLKCINNKLCVRCGIDVSCQKYKICQDCRRKELAIKRQKYIDLGLCKTCGINEIRAEDKTICQRCFDRLKKNRKIRRHKLKIEIFEHYGNKCNCCGESIVEFLTIDHVNNDGAEHKRMLNTKDSDRVYKDIQRQGYPDDYQILCYNCNYAKGIHGRCPHQK